MSKEKQASSEIFNLYKSLPQIKVNIPYKNISNKSIKSIYNIEKKYSNSDVRILIRFSGTEPLIRLLVEGENIKKVKSYINILEKEIRLKIEK